MAETKLNAALRPNQGVRHTATHSGVTHVRAYQPSRYTIVGNHLAQHRELSLTAIGLAVHILSLPEGAPADIRTLAARFPEGRDRIAFALRELEAVGYIDRVRERLADGRVITRTYAYNAPALTRAAPGHAPDGPSGLVTPAAAPCRDDTPDASTAPAAPVVPAMPALPVAEAQCTAVEDERPEKPVPPTPESAADPEPPRSEHHDKAFALLTGLRHTDDRLTLSARDVRRLTPAAVAWFENGASRAAVHHALTADVPALLRCPVGFLAHRLHELLPPPLPPVPENSAPPTGAGRSRPHPFQDCDGCHRVFRAPEPGRCRDCRSIPTTSSEVACAA
ncbi:helix-turn-helix domain-containing protein [Streptomyces sp. PSKA30]|uniref:helix-turn-helix domain-containing protein n=1 Tax=Streptomyces sp. PSKA30 TaxID=2874597 RepID=UPI001CD0693E|nr:helix-turn-helix domain-containing protein [Streptomyces sp. PSKA30]MBZ9639533.1 helix-turn-helix domain-containing protein [Streptomyces sp. PSKA30]